MGAKKWNVDEKWPHDDIQNRDLPREKEKARRTSFERCFEQRAPYAEGDGKVEFAAFEWDLGAAPMEIARSAKHSFVDVAVGPRHTVFATRDGITYACGEGSNGQLGSQRVSDDRKKATSLEALLVSGGQRKLARYPTKTFPTGTLEKNGKDVRIAQVSATLTATYCREMNETEASGGLERLVEELKQIEEELPFDFTPTLGRLRAAIAQKCAQMRRLCKGRVFAWGDPCGGPMLAPSLLRNIKMISAGRHHVLALGSALYSWGSGRDGRLGHDDFLDRIEPTAVEFFTRPPRLIAAGDAHSLAVVGECDVFTWGRGAHGRLGLGRHMNKRLPNLVDFDKFSTSFSCRIVDAALGSAHSLVLAEERIDRLLVNPWGSRRRIYSWGFGANGELGNDKVQHCSLPQLVKMPKWEIPVSLAAGRHHSIALTVHGGVYTWGNGQIAPRRVQSKAQFLKVSAGDSRTVGIALRHRAFDKRKIERSPLMALPTLLSNQAPRNCCPEWRCVRSWPVVDEEAPKNLRCETCDMESVCVWCARLCHIGHKFSSGGGGICRCGLALNCRRPPPVSEWHENPKVESSAVRLQKFARRVVATRLLTALKSAMVRSRRIASTNVWYFLMEAVWKKARESCARKSEQVERTTMALADSFSSASRRYFKLQVSLQSIEAQRGIIRRICGATGAPDPISPSTEVRFRSIRALRQWNRERYHHSIRLPQDHLRRWAAKYDLLPFDDDSDRVPDPDLSLFAIRARDEAIHGESHRRHRCASLAAPEKLHSRLRTLRRAQTRKLSSRRRRSLDPRELEFAKENVESVDCAYREGVIASLDLMRKRFCEAGRNKHRPCSDDEEEDRYLPIKAVMEPNWKRRKRRRRRRCPFLELSDEMGRSRSVGAPERLAETKRIIIQHEAGASSHKKP